MTFNNLDMALEAYRSHWSNIERCQYNLRTALSVQHGIVERIQPDQWNRDVAEYLSRSLETLRNDEVSNPGTIVKLVEPALRLGLNVQTPQDLHQISKATGYFGVVQNVEDDIANISFYVQETTKNPTNPILESIKPQVSMLPQAYRKAGVWICWIEYQFRDGRKSVGNFEPASSLPAPSK